MKVKVNLKMNLMRNRLMKSGATTFEVTMTNEDGEDAHDNGDRGE